MKLNKRDIITEIKTAITALDEISNKIEDIQGILETIQEDDEDGPLVDAIDALSCGDVFEASQKLEEYLVEIGEAQKEAA